MPTVPDIRIKERRRKRRKRRKKKKRRQNMHGKKWPYNLRFPPGQLARRERQRTSTYCCCGSPPLQKYCWTYVCLGLYLPRRLWRAGRAGRVRGKGTCAAVSTILRGSCSGGGFAGRTATAAGSGWTCWRSQECSAQSLSRVLCCTLCLTSKEDPAGVTQEEHLLLLGNKTTA